MQPRHPIFIPSKGRAETRLTMKMFDRFGVPYTVFVEAQEFDAYAAHIPASSLHVLPHRDEGLTVTRNYIWDYATLCGHEWFWTFDDNIHNLYRFNHNLKIPCADASVLAAVEDFTERYENTAITGLNYFMFVKRKYVIPPYILNTRVYSNMLIRTNATDKTGNIYRNNLYFNDDTDLCLRVLKDGWCTVLFNAFLIEKATTMTVSGGNTEIYVETDQRREFVEELQRAHPDFVQLTRKWDRWHHHVDYSRFKQQLRRRADVVIPETVNEFGMQLQEKVSGRWQPLDLTTA